MLLFDNNIDKKYAFPLAGASLIFILSPLIILLLTGEIPSFYFTETGITIEVFAFMILGIFTLPYLYSLVPLEYLNLPQIVFYLPSLALSVTALFTMDFESPPAIIRTIVLLSIAGILIENDKSREKIGLIEGLIVSLCRLVNRGFLTIYLCFIYFQLLNSLR